MDWAVRAVLLVACLSTLLTDDDGPLLREESLRGAAGDLHDLTGLPALVWHEQTHERHDQP
jgi:hypothetical protein